MAQQGRDFWPSLGLTQIVPPVAILREQAAALTKKAQGLIEGQVDTSVGGDNRFYHRLYVVAPGLDNYKYQLLGVYHGIGLYPVYVAASGESKTERQLDSAQEFLDWLQSVLGSDQTKRVLDALMAQIRG